jgi:hypothetical protein
LEERGKSFLSLSCSFPIHRPKTLHIILKVSLSDSRILTHILSVLRESRFAYAEDLEFIMSDYLQRVEDNKARILYIDCKYYLFAYSHSLGTDQSVANEGAIKIAEALKSNTSLTSLSLSSNILFLLHLILTQYS